MMFQAGRRFGAVVAVAATLASWWYAVEAQQVAPPTRLLVTPERRAVWDRVRKDGPEWFQILKRDTEGRERYADWGVRATILWQITGDRKYFDLAWKHVQAWAENPKTPSANETREQFLRVVLQVEWLRNGMTQAQQDLTLAALNRWATTVVKPGSAQPILPSDSDQSVGNYFGLAWWYLTTKDRNPLAEQYWSLPWVGGFDATAADRTTLRNTLRQYIERMAAGGEWIESSEYNLGTVRLLILGVEGVKTLTGVEHFPEARVFFRQAGEAMIQTATSDLLASMQWGDVESPRNFEAGSRVTTAAMLAGVLEGDPIGPAVQDFVLDVSEQYGTKVTGDHTWPRVWYLFNPYAKRGDRTTLPTRWYAPGQGMTITRSGWKPRDTTVLFHMRGKLPYVHHQISFWGDIQIYRRGQWALTHPIGYGGPSLGGSGTNTATVGTFSTFDEGRFVTAQEQTDEYAYVSGTQGGGTYGFDYYDPPPPFLHEWTRSLVYLPGAIDVVAAYDRMHLEDPRVLPKLTRYRREHLATLKAAPRLVQWFWHMPTAPTVTASSIAWQAPGDQSVQIDQVSGQPAQLLAEDQKAVWANLRASRLRAGEKQWQVRIVPDTDAEWQTRLQVVQVRDGGNPATTVPLTADGVEGVLIRRPGQPDAVLLFGAKPGEKLPSPLKQGPRYAGSGAGFDEALRSARRVPAGGYTVSLTSDTAKTVVLLFDLREGSTWTASIDGQPARPLTVSPAGVARLDLASAGKHTIKVSAQQ